MTQIDLGVSNVKSFFAWSQNSIKLEYSLTDVNMCPVMYQKNLARSDKNNLQKKSELSDCDPFTHSDFGKILQLIARCVHSFLVLNQLWIFGLEFCSLTASVTISTCNSLVLQYRASNSTYTKFKIPFCLLQDFGNMPGLQVTQSQLSGYPGRK